MLAKVLKVVGQMAVWAGSTSLTAGTLALGGVIVLSEGPLPINPEVLGMQTQYSYLVNTGMGSEELLEFSIERFSGELSDGRLFGRIAVHLPNFDEAVDGLLDIDDVRSGDVEYHHGDLIYATTDTNNPRTLNLRVRLRVRTYLSVAGIDIGSNSHDHHFNIAATVEHSETELSLRLNLGPKDGFPNWAESEIQSFLTENELHIRLTESMQARQVQIEDVFFSGGTRENSLTLHVAASLPVEEVVPLTQEEVTTPRDVIEIVPRARTYGGYCSRITRAGLCAHAF